ncbi:MAG: hypothetical protein MK135_11990, partial [Polyangiaceae bacterium]|nr:hypothetical protein [Polyangiaceae bacterium]
AGHSVAIRWVANPFLDAYRELLQRYPEIWVIDPQFPKYLDDFIQAVADGDEEKAAHALRAYYETIDSTVRAAFQAVTHLDASLTKQLEALQKPSLNNTKS